MPFALLFGWYYFREQYLRSTGKVAAAVVESMFSSEKDRSSDDISAVAAVAAIVMETDPHPFFCLFFFRVNASAFM